ncbi:MAG: SDR family oxidoreductase [Candidatus Hydrogenedentes bacterium]|nr:SDR family oxidoreductase [Candidatus Hydrogenedentota bacterium]
MSRILVTGGAGFIGSHLVHALVGRGHDVRVLDDFSTGRLSNLFGIVNSIHLVEGSITDREIVQKAVDEIDYCFHFAALPSVQRSIASPDATNGVNVTGSVNLFLACRTADVKRIIYASSSSVYGAANAGPLAEDRPCAPMSPYAVSKFAVENYARVFAALYTMEIVGLRFFNVFGPKQDPNSPYAAAIPLFISAIRAGQAPIVFGDGKQSRDFTYIDNVVDANIRAMEAPSPLSGIFNVACGASTSVLEILRMLGEIMNVTVQPSFEPPRPGEIPWSQASIARAHDAFGYTPAVGVRDGLSRTIEWTTGQGAEEPAK